MTCHYNHFTYEVSLQSALFILNRKLYKPLKNFKTISIHILCTILWKKQNKLTKLVSIRCNYIKFVKLYTFPIFKNL